MKKESHISVKEIMKAAGLMVIMLAVIFAVFVFSNVEFRMRDVTGCFIMTMAALAVVNAFSRKKTLKK